MSIRRRIAILVLVVGLLPALIIGSISYLVVINELNGGSFDQLESVVVKQRQKIDGLLQARQEEAVNLSNNFDLQSTLGRYLSNGSQASRSSINSILINTKVESRDIQAIYLADLNGKIISRTNTSDNSVSLSAEDYDLKAGEETLTFIKEDERDGIIKLYITTKVSVNRQSAGYLNMIFRIDDIIAAVQDYSGLGSTGETMVFGADAGGELVSLFPLRFDTDAALNARLETLKLSENTSSSYSTKDYRNMNVNIVSRPVGFADWTIATKIDKSEALAPMNQLRIALVVIVAVLVAAAILTAFYFTKFFTDPILRISSAARRIGEGDLAARVSMNRDDEIGALSNSINTMGHNLSALVTNLESQRKQLEIILNSASESILAVDSQGVILIANQSAANLARLSMREVVGKNIKELFAWRHELQPFDIDLDIPDIKTYFDVQYTDPFGALHYVKIIVARASTKSNEGPKAIVTVHDETKSRELENMKIDFVSMAAHELRTPLAAIRGYLELISYKGKKSIDDDMENYLKQALRSTAELGALINNLLNVTRIERGALTFHPEKVDMAAEIHQVLDDSKFSIEDKKLEVTYGGVDSGAYVAADKIALREVIGNLVSNAVKYTENGGKVGVLLREDGDDYKVYIKDTGIGIPEKALPNLFTKFFRAHSGLNSGNPGTGLGLFIAKSILERHGGSISVQSREGVGSVFVFSLPKWSEEVFKSIQSDEDEAKEDIERYHGWVTKNSSS